MKKKYLVSSVLLALLMLVSTQVVFMNTTKAYPTPHTGNADVGYLWMTELNVSSELRTIVNIGVAHVNATDDWVSWTSGSGNITAHWSATTGNKHPEYYVIFALSVFNIDEGCVQIGNVTVTRTINSNQIYFSGGTLTVPISLNKTGVSYKTLVCYLGASIKINETEEAKNFTCLADDRAVVSVSFNVLEQARHKFSTDINKVNSNWPAMWSWVDDWEDYYDDENDMLNNQTYFNVGCSTSGYSGGNKIWYLGTLAIDIQTFIIFTAAFTPDNLIENWSYNAGNGHWATGPCALNYSIDPRPYANPIIKMRYLMRCTELNYKPIATWPFAPKKTWINGITPNTGSINARVQAEDIYANGNDYINLELWVWATNGIIPEFINHSTAYQIHIVEGQSNSPPSGGQSYYWEDDCAYQNSTAIDVSSQYYFGITTVYADISDILNSDDQYIYSYAADVGDTRVEFTCE